MGICLLAVTVVQVDPVSVASHDVGLSVMQVFDSAFASSVL